MFGINSEGAAFQKALEMFNGNKDSEQLLVVGILAVLTIQKLSEKKS